MMPRSQRLLIGEVAMWTTTAAGIAAARRTFSDAARDLKSIEEVQNEAKENKHASRRLSDFVAGQMDKQKQKKQPSVGSKRDVWLVTFTDVVLRCKRVGVTNLPMGLQHCAPKDGGRKSVALAKQGRNLYKFIKVDHWIVTDQTHSRSGTVNMEAVARSRLSTKPEETEPSSDSGDEHVAPVQRLRQPTEKSDGASRMRCPALRRAKLLRRLNHLFANSFTYTGDVPRPAFDVDPLIGLVQSTSDQLRQPVVTTSRKLSPTTQEVVNRQASAEAKFGNRMRPLEQSASPVGSRGAQMRNVNLHGAGAYGKVGNFNKPTAAYLAKQAAVQDSSVGAAKNGLPGRRNLTSPLPLPKSKRVRAASSNTSSAHTSPKASPLPPPVGSRVRRSSFSGALPEPSRNTRLRTKHSSEKLGRARQVPGMNSGVALFS